jgi:hypothetical protein
LKDKVPSSFVGARPSVRPLDGMKRAHHKLLALALAGMSVTAIAAGGSVCVAPVPKATSGSKSLSNPTASAVPYEFAVTLGARAPIATSHTKSLLVGGLDTSQSHLVIIRQGAKRAASFQLRFSTYKTDHLCLWFGPLYESWSVWPATQSRGKCACSGNMAPNTSLERTRDE